VARILTETDGPFTKHEEGPAHPRDVRAVVHALAQILGATPSEVEEMIVANLRLLESSADVGILQTGNGGASE